jgi:hypothetical protein
MNEQLLDSIRDFAKNSLMARYIWESIWAQSVYTMQGVYTNGLVRMSDIRGVPQSQFRMSASTLKQLTAAIYTAFLKDKKTVQVIPAGNLREDEIYASAFDYILEVYADYMRASGHTYEKHQDALEDAFLYGFCIGRFATPLTPGAHITYDVIPPDRIYMDWKAPSLEQSECIIIEHYFDQGEWIEFCESTGYADDGTVTMQVVRESELRMARLNMPTNRIMEFPSIVAENLKYVVWECYIRLGSHWNIIYIDNLCNVAFTPLRPIPFLPFVCGYAYYVAHRCIGDMLAAWTADAEGVYNAILNGRLDNLDLSMNPPMLYPPDCNLDIASIRQNGLRAGSAISVDDPSRIKFLETPNVTQTAYTEASVAEGILRNLAGLPDQQVGTSGTPAETVSQIYQTEAKKIDLLLGTWSETYWEPWHRTLLRMLCLYGPDSLFERAIRSAYGAEKVFSLPLSVSEFRNFDPLRATLYVAHTTYASKEDAKTLMDLTTQAIQSNNASLQLYQQQLIPKDQLTIMDISILFGKALDKLGVKGVSAFVVTKEAEEQAKAEAEEQQAKALQAQAMMQQQAAQPQQVQGQPQPYQGGAEEHTEEIISHQPDGTIVKQKHVTKQKQGVGNTTP